MKKMKKKQVLENMQVLNDKIADLKVELEKKQEHIQANDKKIQELRERAESFKHQVVIHKQMIELLLNKIFEQLKK